MHQFCIFIFYSYQWQIQDLQDRGAKSKGRGANLFDIFSPRVGVDPWRPTDPSMLMIERLL